MRATIEVRPAEAGDAEHLVEFNIAMARETEGKELALEVVTRGVQSMLKHPEYGFYLVATCDGRPAGALMITSEWSDWRNGLFWWIQSVYVTPEQRGRGVYRALYASVLELAREASGVCGLRLYVERENETAQRVYCSLGMENTGYLVFEELLTES